MIRTITQYNLLCICFIWAMSLSISHSLSMACETHAITEVDEHIHDLFVAAQPDNDCWEESKHKHIAQENYQCGDPTLLAAYNDWGNLNNNTRQFIFNQTKRPSKRELEKIQTSRHFAIHYSMKRPHRPITKDGSDRSVQVWIDQLEYYLEMAYFKFIKERKYMPPVSDGLLGGGMHLYDVYVRRMGNGITGLTCADGPLYKDATQAITYMFISNDIPEQDLYGGNPLKGTAAHEFFHMIQNGYYGSALATMSGNKVHTAKSTSLREGTAAWAEGVIYGNPHRELENKSYYAYLHADKSIFNSPYKHLLINEESDVSLYAYSTVYFWRYLSDRFGETIIKQIWESNQELLHHKNTISKEMEVLENVLSIHGGFHKVLADFFVSLALLRSDKVYKKYQQTHPSFTFKKGRDYAKFLSRNSPVKNLVAPKNITQTIRGKSRPWHSPNTSEKVFWNLKAVGGAAYHTIFKNEVCHYRIRIRPSRATHNVLQSDLYAVLIKHDTRNQQIAVDYAEFDVRKNYTEFVDNNPAYDKLTLIVYRLTDLMTAKNLGTGTIRYEIDFHPLQYCLSEDVVSKS